MLSTDRKVKIFSWTTLGVVGFCAAVSALIFTTNIPQLLTGSVLEAGSLDAAATFDVTVQSVLIFLVVSSIASIFVLGTSFKWLQFHLGNGAAAGALGKAGLPTKKLSKRAPWHPHEVVESLTFLWVFSALIFSLYNIYLLFTHSDGILHLLVIQSAATEESGALSEENFRLLLNLSFYCGLLGGTLANLKFFLRSHYDSNPFKIDYVYRYIANPFVSIAVGFLTFLLLIALPYQGNLASLPFVHPVSYIFLFCLAGYFSDSFFLILRTLANAIESFVSAPTELAELKKQKLEKSAPRAEGEDPAARAD